MMLRNDLLIHPIFWFLLFTIKKMFVQLYEIIYTHIQSIQEANFFSYGPTNIQELALGSN